MRRGFTLTELTTVLVLGGMGGCRGAVAMGLQPEPEEKPAVSGDPEAARAEKERISLAKQLKCATQVRSIHQGFIVFANNNRDRYPLPSLVDLGDDTVRERGAEKDTTSNLFSMLIYFGAVSPEMMVSPAESNDKVKVYEEYEYDAPKRAVNPQAALWDPGFSADFSDGNTGNTSYAHLILSKSRHDLWKLGKFDATLPVVGNRGPKVTAVTYKGEPDALKAEPQVSGKSKTFAIHGSPDAWEGNIAFNDNHVEFLTEMTHKRTFKLEPEGERPDVLFFNEELDPTDTNIFMGIFTHAGPSTRNFRAIWD